MPHPPARAPPIAVDDASFEKLQRDFMAMQYDELFAALEKADGSPGLLLIRGLWLRHMTGGEFALPEVGAVLPEEATISARTLRAIFSHVSQPIAERPEGYDVRGSGGYRQVSLPFLTVTQLWTHTHPDPDEDCLRGVLDVLQARWEDFADRDVGVYIDTTPTATEESPSPPLQAVLWLVTSNSAKKPNAEGAAPAAEPAAEPGADGGMPADKPGEFEPKVELTVEERADAGSPAPTDPLPSARSSSSSAQGSSQSGEDAL
jgi:hypothetical protein